jgi:hypothetical protein
MTLRQPTDPSRLPRFDGRQLVASTPIPDVSTEDLAQAALPGADMDKGSRTLMEREFVRLGKRRDTHQLVAPGEHNLTGIALSGGGIRSATFALGVLQALAKEELLKRFDYLSTVSGGGYIGGSLTWWLSEKSGSKPDVGAGNSFGVGKQDFPYGTESPIVWRGQPGTTPGAKLLTYLRKHGNYLTPGEGITALSAVSVVLRAVILNLAVWLPLVTTTILVLLFGLDKLFGSPPQTSSVASAPVSEATVKLLVVDALLIALVFAGFAAAYFGMLGCTRTVIARAPKGGSIACSASAVRRALAGSDWRIWLPLIAVAALGVLWAAPPEAETWRGLELLLGIAGILATTFLVLCVVYAIVTGLHKWLKSGTLRRATYAMRRLFETWARFYLYVIGGLALMGSIPALAEWLTRNANGDGTAEVSGGIFALIAGLAAAGVTFWRSGSSVTAAMRARGFRVPGGVMATLAAGFLLLGVLMISHDMALRLYSPLSAWVTSSLQGTLMVPDPMVIGWLAALAVAVLSGWIVNVNHISLGRFYRDRLMEAFMPGYQQALEWRTGAAPSDGDEMTLNEASPCGPYHIINTNVVLIEAEDRRRCIRGGDNFILTPDYCGSNATGWTTGFMDDGMTLATAVAISGAAANPNTGVGGVGLTRSRVLSVLMALLNMRLGYWVPKPSGRQDTVPNHFHPAFSALLSGHRETSAFQELTDGGHFENLGIYELIRRRVRLILVCDGTQDAGFQFEDLQVALRRIGEDFGARVEFSAKYPFKGMIPTAEEHPYPRGLRLAKRGFAVARILYPPDYDRSGTLRQRESNLESTLIYLTTTMIEGLPIELLGYRAKNPEFPDQSTSDQFFDEDQFEAYRELGYRIAKSMISALSLGEMLEKIQPSRAADDIKAPSQDARAA